MIDKSFRLALFASASLIAGLPAAAQTAAADAAVTNDAEIIVSARRRDERLIDVPVAVTAFSQADLQKYQAVDLSGLQAAAPNLNLVQGRGSAASANIFIRGIGQPDALQTFDPAVGVYVDGVYLSRITTTSSTLGALNNLTFRFPGSLPVANQNDNVAEFDAWTPSVTLAWKPDSNSQLYVSASRGFKSGGFNGRWYVQGGVKNLGDERYRTDGQEFSSVGNIQTVYYGDPRTWNVMVGFKF